MISRASFFLAFATTTLVSAQQSVQLLSDPGTSGPQLEIVHLYYDEWPTGTWLTSSYLHLWLTNKRHCRLALGSHVLQLSSSP